MVTFGKCTIPKSIDNRFVWEYLVQLGIETKPVLCFVKLTKATKSTISSVLHCTGNSIEFFVVRPILSDLAILCRVRIIKLSSLKI